MATVLMVHPVYASEANAQEADAATWEAEGWQPVKSKEAKK